MQWLGREGAVGGRVGKGGSGRGEGGDAGSLTQSRQSIAEVFYQLCRDTGSCLSHDHLHSSVSPRHRFSSLAWPAACPFRGVINDNKHINQ